MTNDCKLKLEKSDLMDFAGMLLSRWYYVWKEHIGEMDIKRFMSW